MSSSSNGTSAASGGGVKDKAALLQSIPMGAQVGQPPLRQGE